MEKYKVVFEFVNGNRKAITIDRDSFLELDKSILENETWFKYGRDSINLKTVCFSTHSLVEDKEQTIDEQVNNEAQAFMDWK